MSVPDWKTLPSLASLRAFDAAARCLSFSEAGRSLNVTHAAIAQQVRALETELGVSLVRRAGRGIALTEAGSQLAATLGDGFELIAGGVTQMRAAQAQRGLRVTTTPNMVDDFLLRRMGSFWSAHPEIEVSFLPSVDNLDLETSGFDLGIRSGEHAPEDLGATFLTDTRWILVGAPSLVGDGDCDLGRLPWTFIRGSEQSNELVRRAGFDPGTLQVLDMGGPPRQLRMAREGYCIALCTEFLVRDDVAAGRLRAFEFADTHPVFYWATTPKGPRRPTVDLFIGWLQKVFADDPRPPVPKSDGIPM